jgi:hypothetical protein
VIKRRSARETAPMADCFPDQYQNGVTGWVEGTSTTGAACGTSVPLSPVVTAQDFGKDDQYGVPDLSFCGGTLISKVKPGGETLGAYLTCPETDVITYTCGLSSI